jgi:hypothetical protein
MSGASFRRWPCRGGAGVQRAGRSNAEASWMASRSNLRTECDSAPRSVAREFVLGTGLAGLLKKKTLDDCQMARVY